MGRKTKISVIKEGTNVDPHANPISGTLWL